MRRSRKKAVAPTGAKKRGRLAVFAMTATVMLMAAMYAVVGPSLFGLDARGGEGERAALATASGTATDPTQGAAAGDAAAAGADVRTTDRIPGGSVGAAVGAGHGGGAPQPSGSDGGGRPSGEAEPDSRTVSGTSGAGDADGEPPQVEGSVTPPRNKPQDEEPDASTQPQSRDEESAASSQQPPQDEQPAAPPQSESHKGEPALPPGQQTSPDGQAAPPAATESKQVALTFDDGPDAKYTPLILDVLKEHDVKATFFVVGKQSEAYPDVLKRIHEEGHVIGNHSFAHADLSKLSAEQVQEDIAAADEAIERIVGASSALFRAPYGAESEVMKECLADSERELVRWTVDTRDWAGTSPEEMMEKVHKQLKPGGIILMHSFGGKKGKLDNTVEVLPQLIEELKEQGYSFVTVPELSTK